METKGTRLLPGTIVIPQKRQDANLKWRSVGVDSRDVTLVILLQAETPGQLTQTGRKRHYLDAEGMRWDIEIYSRGGIEGL